MITSGHVLVAVLQRCLLTLINRRTPVLASATVRGACSVVITGLYSSGSRLLDISTVMHEMDCTPLLSGTGNADE